MSVKKLMAVLLTVILIGGNKFYGVAIAKADKNHESIEIEKENSQEKKPDMRIGEESEMLSSNNEPVSETGAESRNEHNPITDEEGALCESKEGGDLEFIMLCIPQKVEIVIDPWEIDKRGQIYSEHYTVRNVGETAGILTFVNYMEPSMGQDEVVITTDQGNLHQGQEKTIYLEMALENGDKAVFTQEGSAYTVRLEPDEEFAFWFIGEVNENASCQWGNQDVLVWMDYIWDMEDKTDIEAEAKEISEPSGEEREQESERINEDNLTENGQEELDKDNDITVESGNEEEQEVSEESIDTKEETGEEGISGKNVDDIAEGDPVAPASKDNDIAMESGNEEEQETSEENEDVKEGVFGKAVGNIGKRH